MNRQRQPNNRNQPPPRSRWRKWVAVCLFLVVVALVISYFNRHSIGLWAARRSLNSNAPHEALAWLEWSDRQGGNKKRENRLFEALVQNRLGFATAAKVALLKAEGLGATIGQLEDHVDLIDARLGDIHAAERLSKNETAAVPVREFFHAVVRCAMYRGRLGWGHALLDRWREQFPDDAAERYLRGRIFELEEDSEKAADCYEQAITRQGNYPEAAFRLGILHRDSSEFDKAEASFRLCLNSPYEEIARIEIAECLLLQGEAEKAAKMLDPVLKLEPESTLRQYLPAEVYMEDDRAALVGAALKVSLKQRDEAAKLYLRALDHNPRNLQARSQLSVLLRLLERDTEADKHLAIHRRLSEQQAETVRIRTELEDSPDDLDLRCDLAELHLECTSMADAQIELQRVLERDPEFPRAHSILRRLNGETQ